MEELIMFHFRRICAIYYSKANRLEKAEIYVTEVNFPFDFYAQGLSIF